MKNTISENDLTIVSGGADSSAAGAVEYPILINTDERAERFSAEAAKCSFAVTVTDHKKTADAKVMSEVLALDRSHFVTCHAQCANTDYFARVILADLAW